MTCVLFFRPLCRSIFIYHTTSSYSYLATVPLLVVFSVAMAALKFSEGSFLALQNPTFSDTPSGYFMLPSGESASVARSSVEVTNWASTQSFRNLWHYGNMTTGTGCCPSIFCWASLGLSNCESHELSITLLLFASQGNTFRRSYCSPWHLFMCWISNEQSWHSGYFSFTKAQESGNGFTAGSLEPGAQVRSFYPSHSVV